MSERYNVHIHARLTAPQRRHRMIELICILRRQKETVVISKLFENIGNRVIGILRSLCFFLELKGQILLESGRPKEAIAMCWK